MTRYTIFYTLEFLSIHYSIVCFKFLFKKSNQMNHTRTNSSFFFLFLFYSESASRMYVRGDGHLELFFKMIEIGTLTPSLFFFFFSLFFDTKNSNLSNFFFSILDLPTNFFSTLIFINFFVSLRTHKNVGKEEETGGNRQEEGGGPRSP